MPFFFHETNQALTSFRELFDFTWTTHVALWNLRWQVQGFRRAVPNATNETLKARFSEGHDRSEVNLEKTCEEWSWEHQEHSLTRFVLGSAFGIYEGWLDAVLTRLGVSSDRGAVEKGLQFPTRWGNGAASSPTKGYRRALSLVRGNSYAVAPLLQPALKKHRKYPKGDIEALLSCLRFFKECRNCFAHRGGIADTRLISAEQDFKSTSSALQVKEVPVYKPPVVDCSVHLVLRGVVGFTDVLKKVIVFTDAELALSELAEEVLKERLRDKIPKKRTLPSDDERARRRAVSFFRKAGLEVDGDGSEAASFLRNHHIVR